MTIEIRLTGADTEHAVSDAAVLLREIGACEPERRVIETDDDGARRDPATVIAIASLVLSLPGAVLASMQAMDLMKRKRLKNQIAALKRTLSESECDGMLEIKGVGRVDLVRDSTDAVVDLLLREPNA